MSQESSTIEVADRQQAEVAPATLEPVGRETKTPVPTKAVIKRAAAAKPTRATSPVKKPRTKKSPASKPAATKKRRMKKKKPVVKKKAATTTAANRITVKKRVATKSVQKRPTSKRLTAMKTSAQKTGTKKAAPKRRQTKKQPASNGVNKAQAIRDEASELGKKARPKDIIAALAAKGISVSSPQVSSTLKAAGLRRGRRRRKIVESVAPKMHSTNGHGFNIDDLLKVKKLAEALGGTAKVKELVVALERLA